MKKLFCLLLALILLASSLFGCAERLPDDLMTTGSYEHRVTGLTAYDAAPWDHYILTETYNSIYDRTTGEIVYGLCEDLECDGSCPLDTGSARIVGISKGRIYFSLMNREPHYGYRNILSGEVVYLLKISMEEMLPNRPMFLDGGWVYLTRKHLKEGGNPENANDYVPYLSRIPEDGGKEELLYAMRGNSETLILIADGIMFTWYESKIWRTDLATWEQSILHDLTTSEIDGLRQHVYLDGYLYFDPSHASNLPYIVRMNATTGEWDYVLEEPVARWIITNDTIYFLTFDDRQINDPILYPRDGEDAYIMSYAPTLYACDLDGSNVRAVWTEKTGCLDFATSNFTVIDNALYGWIRELDFENNMWKDRYFAEIRFDTGEIIPATVVQ